jgi:small subunit ribosomal protein S16
VAVKIRLMRLGCRNNPVYRIVVVDSRKRRDADFIENIGSYYPRELDFEKQVKVDLERFKYWLSRGAIVTHTVYTLIKRRYGVLVPKNQIKKK